MPSNRGSSHIYLSGPISLGGGASQEVIAAFTAVFSHEAERLQELGYEVTNPCDLPPLGGWEEYMRHGIRAVTECDLVAVLPRWIESRGAVLEVFVATQLGIPVLPVAEVAA